MLVILRHAQYTQHRPPGCEDYLDLKAIYQQGQKFILLFAIVQLFIALEMQVILNASMRFQSIFYSQQFLSYYRMDWFHIP